MKRLIDLSFEDAKAHFLKGSSYFNGDLPKNISFEPILKEVTLVLKGKSFADFKGNDPSKLSGVNYSFLTNKDGKLSWRPYELMHPVIYVSLINTLCEETNWARIRSRLDEFKDGIVDCCSAPVMSIDHQTDVATQVRSWWQKVEQRSLIYSLEYSHLIHTDVTDCYGTLYTHSIAWAIHGLEESKKKKQIHHLLGNKIDRHIRAGRYGQTNGICQGSVLMDFIAEIVLGYVDSLINAELKECTNVRILRYRDDYRIFANSDDQAERILKLVSDKLRTVGMKLGVSKTYTCRNVVEGSIKPDKLAGIELPDLGISNAKTVQKQLLRLHSFGQRFTNSGALRRLVWELHTSVLQQKDKPDDLEVQVAIATDIAFVSPATFPAIAGILSHLISLAPKDEKCILWNKVLEKMRRVPYNGYLEVWLQRIIQPRAVGLKLDSKEPICQIVNGVSAKLWESDWISSRDLLKALGIRKIVISDVEEMPEVVQPEEIELFKQNAWEY
jgi:RNA-directed DNA polymerase